MFCNEAGVPQALGPCFRTSAALANAQLSLKSAERVETAPRAYAERAGYPGPSLGQPNLRPSVAAGAKGRGCDPLYAPVVFFSPVEAAALRGRHRGGAAVRGCSTRESFVFVSAVCSVLCNIFPSRLLQSVARLPSTRFVLPYLICNS